MNDWIGNENKIDNVTKQDDCRHYIGRVFENNFACFLIWSNVWQLVISLSSLFHSRIESFRHVLSETQLIPFSISLPVVPAQVAGSFSRTDCFSIWIIIIIIIIKFIFS